MDEFKYADQKHDNIVVDYAKVMGSARALYTGGFGKYMLDRIDRTMIAGTDIVRDYTSECRQIPTRAPRPARALAFHR